MIEIICREDLQKGEEDASKEKRSMPKNIRQVGKIGRASCRERVLLIV